MERRRPGIGAELVPLLMILACLAGTVTLVIGVQKQKMSEAAARAEVKAQAILLAQQEPPKVSKPAPLPPPPPQPAPPAPQPVRPAPEDPTAKALAALASEEAAEKAAIKALGDKIQRSRAAVAEAEKHGSSFRSKIVALQGQINPLNTQADRLEMEAAKASIEVDVLEREREKTKQLVEKVGSKSSYAILPHKGPNGTWRRPIVIECHDSQVTLRPNGPTFGLGELLEFGGFGNSTFRGLVAREAIRVQRGVTPDGRSVVPYFYFLVRPDGIKSYYAARRQLEPLGITFGYEMADADWELEYPNLDDPENWLEATLGKSEAVAAADQPGSGVHGTGTTGIPGETGQRGDDNPFVWPTSPDRGMARGGVPSMPGELGTPGTLNAPPGGFSAPPGSSGTGDGLPPTGGGPRSREAGSRLKEFGDAYAPNTGESRNGGAPGGLDFANPGGGLKPSELPPGLGGEPVIPRSEDEQAWAKELSRRGFPASAINGMAREPGRIGDILAQNGLLPGSHDQDDDDPQPPGTLPRSDGRGGGGASGAESGSKAHGDRQGAKQGSLLPGGNAGSGSGIGSSRIEGYEIVIACEARGVAIHPGDYRVTLKGLAGKDPILSSQLKALVKTYKEDHPGKIVVPSIKFLVEPGGHSTFSKARTQIALEGIDWPTSMQVSGGDVLRGLSREDW